MGVHQKQNLDYLTCFNCQQKGHKQDSCTQPRRKELSPLSKTPQTPTITPHFPKPSREGKSLLAKGEPFVRRRL